MLDAALFSLSWRVARRRLLGSPPAVVSGLAFPAVVLWIGLADDYGSAAKLFFFLLPHVFLITAQDAVRSDLESGVLENVLFLGGRFRGYLAAKILVLAAAAGVYAAALFGLFAAWGAAAGGFRTAFLVQFALAVAAGLYYVALAGVLSHFLRAGSNVLGLLLAQAAVLAALIVSATARTGLLDHIASGRFPGLGPKLAFGGLIAVLPNVIVSGRPGAFALVVPAGLVLLILAERRLLGRLEIRGRGGWG